MNLDLLLEQVKMEAHRGLDAGLDDDTAWQRAIVTAIRNAAERPDVTPLQVAVLKFVYTKSPEPHSPAVTTGDIERHVPLIDNQWQAWYNADQLKKAGYLYKPGGKHSRTGYKVTDAGRMLIEERAVYHPQPRLFSTG